MYRRLVSVCGLLWFCVPASVCQAADEADHYPGAVEVFSCRFDDSADADYDEWPDGWTRRRGPGFPAYVTIKIVVDPQPPSTASPQPPQTLSQSPPRWPAESAWQSSPELTQSRCLAIELDGGAAAAYSPPIKVSPLLSYVLEADIRTAGLKNHRAFLSLSFLDEKQRRLETVYSEKLGGTTGWRRITVPPIAAANKQVRLAVIGLHLEPEGQGDLRGTAMFRDVWLGSLPRMELTTNDPQNLFTTSQNIEATCTVSGWFVEQPKLVFRVMDPVGRAICEHKAQPECRELTPQHGETAPPGQPSKLLESRFSWKLPLAEPGYYRMQAELHDAAAVVWRRRLTLAVVEPRRPAPGNEFGWTVPTAHDWTALAHLERLASYAALGKVKLPLWLDAEDQQQYQRAAQLVERLSQQGVEVVGMLCNPPPKLRSQYAPTQRLAAAEIFSASEKLWYPSLEPVLLRLAALVHRWQLGGEDDFSFRGYPELPQKMAAVQTHIQRVHWQAALGLPWNWIDGLPQSAGPAPWRFLSLSVEPPLNWLELASYLQAPAPPGVERWVVLRALPAGRYELAERVVDLVERMLAAKIHGAAAVFCADPLDLHCGLLNPDGTPADLLLPWRTTALAIGGSRYLGVLELPGGTPNHVFARDGKAVIVARSQHPIEEPLPLGTEIVQHDVWGRNVTLPPKDGIPVMMLDTWPTFISGVSAATASWAIQLKLETDRVPSIFDRAHQNALCFSNTFPEGVSGKATIVAPPGWRVQPKQTAFNLAAGEQARLPFTITMPYDAANGRHKLRIDFDIEGQQRWRFSVYRHIDVGLGDVYLEIATVFNSRGELQVVQKFVNDSPTAAQFRCELFAPDRRRQKILVALGPQSSETNLYILPDGHQLLGKTLWLRAEEVGGSRILNYRFVVNQ